MAEGTVPDDMDPNQPVVKAHYSLPSGRETFAVIAYDLDENTPVLPFTALDGIVFLRDVNDELINVSFIHRIEGLPDHRPPLPMTGSV